MAGAGYTLFNTGDVLTAGQVNNYLQEQTVMRFANATARTTALSGVLAEGMVSYLDDINAVQVYNGSAWVNVGEAGDITAVTAGIGISGGGTSGDVTVTNSMATAIDAKGDLIAGTADNSFSRLAVGNNGETLVADSSASTGLRWQGNFAAGKNKIINGDFGIWQRGTSFSNPASLAYTADRWAIFYDGTGATRTISRQTFTPGTAPVSGYEGSFFYRYAVSVAGTSNTANLLRQYIESVRTFAGQTVTVSFWAKAASNLTMPSVGLTQNFGTGGSYSGGVDATLATNVAVTTSWQRFSYTAAVPSISGKTLGTDGNDALELRFFLPTGSNTFTFDIWGVQLEAGNVATAFQTATGTLAGELAACQRYYEKSYNIDVAPATNTQVGMVYLTGASDSSNNLGALIQFKVTKRSTPTITSYKEDGTNNNWQYARNGVSVTDASVTWGFAGVNSAFPYVNTGSSYVPALLKGHWAASAEL